MKRAILITARLKSTRLPRKALLSLGGSPLLARLIARMKTTGLPVVVCTSQWREDDPIAELAESEDVHLFRSEPDDVLLRLTQAAETFGVETVLNCTGDNPFVDPTYLLALADFHEAGGYDYSRTEGLPLGSFGFAVNAEAMKKACFLKAERDTEVWGPYFTETGEFHCGVMKVKDAEVSYPELRLTVDTPEDFALAQAITAGLADPLPKLSEIVTWCRRHPEAVALNAHIEQKRAKPIRLRSPQELETFGGEGVGLSPGLPRPLEH